MHQSHSRIPEHSNARIRPATSFDCQAITMHHGEDSEPSPARVHSDTEDGEALPAGPPSLGGLGGSFRRAHRPRGDEQRFWDDLDICPRTASSQGARKCTYEWWFRKPSWAGASALTLPLTHAAMQRFLTFRTGCHGLPKDIGSQSGVPRHQRVCQLCGTGFGDEMHLVFECAAMADLRGQFSDIFQPHQTMQQFMWQPNS